LKANKEAQDEQDEEPNDVWGRRRLPHFKVFSSAFYDSFS